MMPWNHTAIPKSEAAKSEAVMVENMNWLKRQFDALDTPGGHIFVLMFLILVGIGCYFLHYPKYDVIVEAAIGALLYSMKIQSK
jgi:hypothetical protein